MKRILKKTTSPFYFGYRRVEIMIGLIEGVRKIRDLLQLPRKQMIPLLYLEGVSSSETALKNVRVFGGIEHIRCESYEQNLEPFYSETISFQEVEDGTENTNYFCANLTLPLAGLGKELIIKFYEKLKSKAEKLEKELKMIEAKGEQLAKTSNPEIYLKFIEDRKQNIFELDGVKRALGRIDFYITTLSN